jgi:hypothetical protein
VTEPTANLTRVEITAEPRRPLTLGLKVGGRLLPFSAAELKMDAESLPELTVSLPVIDGIDGKLDVLLHVDGETRAALAAMGWTPPREGEAVLVQVECPACGTACAAPAGVLPDHNSPSESPCGASGWTMRGTRSRSPSSPGPPKPPGTARP